MITNKIMTALLIGISTLSLTSCARNISSDVYVANRVGEASMTYAGVIRSVRQVCVEDSEYLGDNQAGIIGGGVAGGLVGNKLGRGGIATAAGAVAGAIGGSIIERKMKRQNGLEYIVDIENGGLMTVVQGMDSAFCPGQPVYVIVSQGGRSRIIAQ